MIKRRKSEYIERVRGSTHALTTEKKKILKKNRVRRVSIYRE